MDIKLSIHTGNVETVDLYSDEVHYRLAKWNVGVGVGVAEVQSFDYSDYDFINTDCFVNEADAQEVANTINTIGAHYFM